MYKGLSVINMKGGVGKTTVAVNLGAEAASRGLKCLVIDLDPQFNASVYLMGEIPYHEDVMENRGLTVFDIFEQHAPMRDEQRPLPTANNVIRQISGHGGRLDVIPSHMEFSETLKNPANKAHLLATFLTQHASDYDLVIVDPPPTDSMATTAAYLATNYVLIPVRPEFLSSVGFPLLGRSVERFKREYPSQSLEIVGMFLANVNTSLPEYAKTKAATQEFAKSRGWRFLNREMRASRSYTHGSREGRTIARTRYAWNDVKDEFSRLADDVFSHMGLTLSRLEAGLRGVAPGTKFRRIHR